MNGFKQSFIKTLPIMAAAVALVVGVTLIAYGGRNKLPEKRTVVFFYDTNVPGTHTPQWAEYLLSNYTALEYAEVQAISVITSTSLSGTVTEKGWNIISARISAGECDILMLDRERYEFLLGKGWLLPITGVGQPERQQMHNGEVYGVRIDGMKLDGLYFPCSVEPHNRVENSSGGEVIACLFFRSTQESAEVLTGIINSATELPRPETPTAKGTGK